MWKLRTAQVVTQKYKNRKDHVFYRRPAGDWKCVLCGAVTAELPPYPTPGDWFPGTFEALTPEERAMCPRRAR